MKRQVPSFLHRKCTEFTGRTLLVRPKGLRYYADWQEQSLDPGGNIQSADMTVTPQSFFEEDGKVTGFVGEIHTEGHLLNSFKAVLSTLSDGEDLDFSDNLCPIWRAAFGDSQPLVGSEGIPEFKAGRVFLGRAVVFEHQVYLTRCRERLDKMDPRIGTDG